MSEQAANKAGNEVGSITVALPKRRFGQWAGNPKGHPEDLSRCIQHVYGTGRYVSYQCSRQRGHGPNGEYCKQHSKGKP